MNLVVTIYLFIFIIKGKKHFGPWSSIIVFLSQFLLDSSIDHECHFYFIWFLKRFLIHIETFKALFLAYAFWKRMKKIGKQWMPIRHWTIWILSELNNALDLHFLCTFNVTEYHMNTYDMAYARTGSAEPVDFERMFLEPVNFSGRKTIKSKVYLIEFPMFGWM